MSGEPWWAPWDAAVTMDIELLRGVGASVSGSGATVERSFAQRAPELTPGGPQPDDGWSAVAATSRAVAAWRSAMSGLSSAVTNHGAALKSAADAQARADAEAAARTRAAGGSR